MARVRVTEEEFLEHLEWNDYLVAHWPKWKQECLGGTAKTPNDVRHIYAKWSKAKQRLADLATGRIPVVYPGD